MVDHFKSAARGFLLAPLPIFLITCVVIVKPSLGMSDMLISLTIAFAGSYGVMALVGLPADFLLRRLRITGMGAYQTSAVFSVWLIVFAVALFEPAAPPFGVGDNNPFAGAFSVEVLFSAFGFIMAGVSAFAAAVTAGLFWLLTVRPRISNDPAI